MVAGMCQPRSRRPLTPIVMFLVPIGLLAALVIVVARANSAKKKGTITESSYQTLVSVSSIIVSIAALTVMFVHLRGR